MKMRSALVCLVASCLLASGCVSGAEEATGTYEGDTNTILTFDRALSSLERRTIPIVPQEGEDNIVIVGWDINCRAEAVVEDLELEISPSTCSFPFQDGTLRLSYEGVGDLSDSGKLDLELSGSATYIQDGGGAAEGTFKFSFSGKRQD